MSQAILIQMLYIEDSWPSQWKIDGSVKSPDAALKLHPSSLRRTPQYASNGDGFQIRPRARLACGLFTKPSHFFDFFTRSSFLDVSDPIPPGILNEKDHLRKWIYRSKSS